MGTASSGEGSPAAVGSLADLLWFGFSARGGLFAVNFPGRRDVIDDGFLRRI